MTSSAGFTLLEAMIATMILGLVLGSVLALSSQFLRYLGDIRRTARSTQIAQQKMEDLRLMSWSQLQDVPATFSDPSDPFGSFSGRVDRSTYRTCGGTTTVARVTVTITWKNSTGSVLTNSLTSLMCNGGLNKYIF